MGEDVIVLMHCQFRCDGLRTVVIQQEVTRGSRSARGGLETLSTITKMPNLYFYIPSDAISKVIGLKGKHIKQLERDYRVTSRIFKEKDPFPTYKGADTADKNNTLWTAMVVSGSTTRVFEACRYVMTCIEDMGDVIIEYSMSKENRQLFFHNNGLPIKRISALSDCRINIPVHDGPVQLECSNLDDAKTALDLVLRHAKLIDAASGVEQQEETMSKIPRTTESLPPQTEKRARNPRQPRGRTNRKEKNSTSTNTKEGKNKTNRRKRNKHAGKKNQSKD
jgi:hypothetical protein